jgi:glycosyltransferase involved in cell wall biosynthesis
VSADDVTRATVLFDATAVPADRGGVGRYVDGIVPALIEAGVDLVVVAQERDRALFERSGARVVVAPSWAASTPGRLIWEQVGLPRIARRLGARVIHSPHYTFPVFTRRRHVVTVHDLTFYSHPEVHGVGKRFFFRSWLRLGALRRVPVVAVSEATGREYRRVFGSHGPLTVAPLGFEGELFHAPTGEELAAFRATAGHPEGDWIAFLGTLEPRKNVVALIAGYERAVEGLPPEARPALLLAGAAGWDPHAGPAVEKAKAAGFDVRLLGYLPVETLSAFLGGAEIVAYPSLGEGFGLPVLEAMATGGVVLTSDRLSLPEVGGDAVAYTGTEPAEIGTALSALLADPERRADLRQRALARAETFSWPQTAARHVDAYRVAEGDAA